MKSNPLLRAPLTGSAFVLSLLLTGCETTPRVGVMEKRQGDEIVVAGRFIHSGTRVVTWMDPGGYDAYRVERRFAPMDKADWTHSHEEVKGLNSPNRYSMRHSDALSEDEMERVRGGGWDLKTLQKVVDQFVIHFDVCGVSRQCFNVLHDHRDLSVHFMLDLDGTIYQTLDLKERAWHATTSNNRSVGIEIANMGAYGSAENKALDKWYARDSDGKVRITIPKNLGDGGIRTKGFVGHPARNEPVRGTIQGSDLIQYDYTPQQYRALTHLVATLSRTFPKLKCDYPKDSSGNLIPNKLEKADLDDYHGVLGHFHVQTDKTDPGPAFQWERVIGGAQQLLHGGFSPAADKMSQGNKRQAAL
jgi:N-acetyl-anhydromuramyl-L-alanine amidase AmpD